MPHLVITPRQCELVIEALLCLKTGRLERENHFEAEELQKLADYAATALAPAAPGRGLPPSDVDTFPADHPSRRPLE